jgi:hypothetical protein
LHDKTHSDTIISNIIRIVGSETLEQLSAIDLWLILSSAYYHDIGMAVFAIDKETIFKEDEFVDLVLSLQEDTRSPLNEYAKCLEVKDRKIYYKNDELNAKNYDSSRFVLAEYVRTRHANRSEKNIVDNISMNLPGSPIPKRIIEILALICKSHAQFFDDVMKLPFCEVGIDSEDCHPRYVACLLRLGDLLDMDNNRFSEVLLQTLNTLPIDSVLHKEKHMSIKHLRIDRERIEARALCETYEVADLTNRWFSLLDEEISNQMKRWNDIVPNMSYGFLPTLGDLIVDLKDYDTIDGKKRPSFDIDASKSIELLQGAGLYSEPYQSIRELLQNATDATLLRIFLEKELNNETIKKENLIDECDKYPISFSIEKSETIEDKIKWKIIISDNGIGFSKNDLSYLVKTGSSNKNTEKNKILERMPEWMKPSGTFGIGFQSVFLLTDKVELYTRKFNKESVFRITLFNPSGNKEGAVLLQTETNNLKKYGTDLTMYILSDKDPERWTVKGEQRIASNVINTFDFVKDESMDIDVAKIIDELYKFSQASYIPIKFKFDKQEEITLASNNKNVFETYYQDKQIEITLNTSRYNNRVFYRNQYIEKSDIHFKFLSYSVNILGGNAKDILTINRNEIKATFKNTLHSNIYEAILYAIKEKYDNFSPELKMAASMFIHYYSGQDNSDLSKFEEWKNYEFTVNEQAMKMHDIIEDAEMINFRFDYNNYKSDIIIKKDDNNYTIQSEESNEVFLFLIKMAYKKLEYISLNSFTTGEKKMMEFILFKDKHDDIIKDWMFWFNIYIHNSFYARGLMPCNHKYIKLQLGDEFRLPTAFDATFRGFNFKYPVMICPYIRKYKLESSFSIVKSLEKELPDELIDMVFENRADKTVTKEEIKEVYSKFISDTETFVQQINSSIKK